MDDKVYTCKNNNISMRFTNVIQMIWMTNLVLQWYGICHPKHKPFHWCISRMHGLLQLQWVLMIFSWLILNAIVFHSLQYSWIIVQMFLKTKPLHWCISWIHDLSQLQWFLMIYSWLILNTIDYFSLFMNYISHLFCCYYLLPYFLIFLQKCEYKAIMKYGW